jgi:hypothetical protein
MAGMGYTPFLLGAAALWLLIGTGQAEAFPVLLSTSLVTLTGLVVPFFRLDHHQSAQATDRRVPWLIGAVLLYMAGHLFLSSVTTGWEIHKRLPSQAQTASDVVPLSTAQARDLLGQRPTQVFDLIDQPVTEVGNSTGLALDRIGALEQALAQGQVLVRVEKPDTLRLLPDSLRTHPNLHATYNPRAYPLADPAPPPPPPAGTYNLLHHATQSMDVFVFHHSDAELFDGTFHFIPAGMYRANLHDFVLGDTGTWLDATLPDQRKGKAWVVGTGNSLHAGAVEALRAVYGAGNVYVSDADDDTDINRDRWNNRTFFSDHILSAAAVTAALQDGHARLVCMDAHCQAHVPQAARVDLDGPHWAWTRDQGLQPSAAFQTLPTGQGDTLIFVADTLVKAMAVQSWYTLHAPPNTRVALTTHPQSLFINKTEAQGAWYDNDTVPAISTAVLRAGYAVSGLLATSNTTLSVVALVALSVAFALAVRAGWRAGLAVGVVHFATLSWMHEIFVFDTALFLRHLPYQDLWLAGGAAYLFVLAWSSRRWLVYGAAAALYAVVLDISPIGAVVAITMLATSFLLDAVGMVRGRWAVWALGHGGITPNRCPPRLQGAKALWSAPFATDTGLLLGDTPRLAHLVARRAARRGPQILRSNHLCALEHAGAGHYASPLVGDPGAAGAAVAAARADTQRLPHAQRQWWLQDLSSAPTTGVAWSMAPHQPLHHLVATGAPGAATNGADVEETTLWRWERAGDTPFEGAVRKALHRCEARVEGPVVVEFGWRTDRLEIFQVRPQTVAGAFHPRTFPTLRAAHGAQAVHLGGHSTFEESLLEGLYPGMLVFDGGVAYSPTPTPHQGRGRTTEVVDTLNGLLANAPRLALPALVEQAGRLVGRMAWLKTVDAPGAQGTAALMALATDLDRWLGATQLPHRNDLRWQAPTSHMPHAATARALAPSGLASYLHHAIALCAWETLHHACAVQAMAPHLGKRYDAQHLPATDRPISDGHPGWVVVDGDFTLPAITPGEVGDWDLPRKGMRLVAERYPLEHIAHVARFGAIDLTSGSPLSHVAHEARSHGVPLRIQPKVPHA